MKTIFEFEASIKKKEVDIFLSHCKNVAVGDIIKRQTSNKLKVILKVIN